MLTKRSLSQQERVLVLGGSGLLGHKLFQVLSERFETWCTVRERPPVLGSLGELFASPRLIDGVDGMEVASVDRVLRELRPTVTLNAVGAIKQRSSAADPVTSITINALLPHRLVQITSAWGGRVIHFSTDCVFSGARGGYDEGDVADAADLYGRTKNLGEVVVGNALTLRTSFIGRELHHHQSLLDWFLANNHGTVRGFTRAMWSGVTANHLAAVVGTIIAEYPGLVGLYHLAGERLSKYDLLTRLRDGLGLDVDIVADHTVINDRSLNGKRFSAATGYRCPSWETLIAELAADKTPYKDWTSNHEVS